MLKKNKTIVLRGIPGSGKSTLAKMLADMMANEGFVVGVFSADDYFMRDGQYKFDPIGISAAHDSCFRGFIDFVETAQSSDTNYIAIIDNTNVCAWEIAPYVLASTSHGFECEIRIVCVNIDDAIRRCIHGVPERAIRRMANDIQTETDRFPPHWIVRS